MLLEHEDRVICLFLFLAIFPFHVFSLLGSEERRKEGIKQASKQCLFFLLILFFKPKWQSSVGKCRKSGNRP
jgi:predicted permease